MERWGELVGVDHIMMWNDGMMWESRKNWRKKSLVHSRRCNVDVLLASLRLDESHEDTSSRHADLHCY